MTDQLMTDKWIKRFLDLADYVSQWSKDPSTQVGAVIVDPVSLRVLSLGYNGFPRGVEDVEERYIDRDTKYQLVVHGEANAILQAGCDLRGNWLFINVPQCCNECMKLVIQAGIDTVVTPAYIPGQFAERWAKAGEASDLMAKEAGIRRLKVHFK